MATRDELVAAARMTGLLDKFATDLADRLLAHEGAMLDVKAMEAAERGEKVKGIFQKTQKGLGGLVQQQMNQDTAINTAINAAAPTAPTGIAAAIARAKANAAATPAPPPQDASGLLASVEGMVQSVLARQQMQLDILEAKLDAMSKGGNGGSPQKIGPNGTPQKKRWVPAKSSSSLSSSDVARACSTNGHGDHGNGLPQCYDHKMAVLKSELQLMGASNSSNPRLNRTGSQRRRRRLDGSGSVDATSSRAVATGWVQKAELEGDYGDAV